MDDPFVSSPEGPAAATREYHLPASVDTQLFSLNASSPSQAKRALEAHLAETERRLQEASKLGTALVQQQKDLTEKLKEVDQQQDEGEIGPDLRRKLVDLEKEYNEIGRESARAFLAPKRLVSGGDGTPSFDLRSPSNPSVFSSQANASPTKVTAPSRKQRNQPSSRVHDIEFATEISTSLLAQVRQLQGMLAEREDALKAANLENSRLELEAEGFTQRIRALDESEQRYKDENWNLETQTHELQAAVKEAADRETRLNSVLSALTAEKNQAQREIEELRQAHGKLAEDQVAAQKAHDGELHALRRTLNSGDAERLTLQAKLEELTSQNQELAKAVATMRSRHAEADIPRDLPLEREDDIVDDITPENSPPPSPSKQTPRHGHLESETLRSSLGHAHRMIQNLKNNIHREKTEKIELKRMLQEARDELEQRRREPSNAPGSGTKRQKTKPDAFKKPLARSDLLGPRRGRTEVALDEMDWEDQTSEASPSRASATKVAAKSGPSTDLSDTYHTATEADDDFETANEREATTESEAFQTGAENPADDDTDELTETEERGSQVMSKRLTSQLSLKKPGNRDSYLSTASTSDDELGHTLQTPVQSQPQRYRLKVGRGGRRIRSGEAPMAFADTGSAHDSPASFIQQEEVPAGQSLFAELEELGSPGAEGEYETPSKSIHTVSQPSTPFQASAPLVAQTAEVPQLPRPVMVDSSMMTEPWEPTTAAPIAAVDPRMLALSDSSTQYTPTKALGDQDAHQMRNFPTPPKMAWDESAPLQDEVTSREVGTSPVVPQAQLEVSEIQSQETAPVLPRSAELQLSPILSQLTEPANFELPEREPVVVVQREFVKPQLPDLFVSEIHSEETMPVTPRLPAVPEPELPVHNLSYSPIHSTETSPVEPILPAAIPPMSLSAQNDAGSRPSTAVHRGTDARELPPLVVAEDTTSQDNAATDKAGSDQTNLPLGAISGNATKQSVGEKMDQGAQTILSSKQIDQLLLERVAGRPTTPGVNDSKSSTPGTTPKAKQPSTTFVFPPPAGPKRPGSAGSQRKNSVSYPPLPPDHKELIAAAQNAQSVPGSMGPPLAPASAFKLNQRPRTPNDTQAKDAKDATLRARARRGSQASRRSSLSSFASEIDERFNISRDGAPNGHGLGSNADPRLIQAITQTMIGEYLWKYTRRTVSGELSNTRHRRYFWVHPYTRTLYWSDQDPQTAGKTELRAKSVPIEAIRVITDDNPYPPGLHRKSIEVVTPGRRVRFTASTSQRHETWFNALSYLLLRTGPEGNADDHITSEDVNEFNPSFRSASRQTGPRLSTSSYNSHTTRNTQNRATSALSMRSAVTPGRASPALSSQPDSVIRSSDPTRMSAASRLSNVLTATIRSSFSGRRSRQALPEDLYDATAANHDSAEDLRQVIEQQEREADRLENVRACCDGKHDVGSLSRNSRYTPGMRRQSQGHHH